MEIWFMPLEMCHLLLTLKNYYKTRSDLRQILEYFAMLSRFHSRGPTYDFGSVTRIAFQHKLTGFRIHCFQKSYFIPKASENSFARSSKRLTSYWLTSHPQNLCRHNLIKACLVFLCFESWWSLVREWNITVIWKTISEAVVGLNLLYPKSFHKQFCAFLKALEFQTICSLKTYATELRMFGWCLFVCFQSRWSQVRERNIRGLLK